MRNLDIASLRSAIVVSETGSVTRAAKRLNMTQSAVSMQIKRLETFLDQALFDRTTSGMALTLAGQQLVTHARKIVETNDTVYSRLTADVYEGEVRVGVPIDIGDQDFPVALRAFKRKFPRARVLVTASMTKILKQDFDNGKFDLILTTEETLDPQAHHLRTEPLVWSGLPDGEAYKQRPLPLGMSQTCAFRPPSLKALEKAGIPWIDTFFGTSFAPITITVAADMCIGTELLSISENRNQVIEHKGTLPDLPNFSIGLQHAAPNSMIECLCEEIERAYA